MARAGIRIRHANKCPTHAPDCGCAKSYEASVWDPRKKVKHRKTFRRLDEAKSWRVDAAKLVKDGKLTASNRRETVEQAGRRWLADAKAGTIRQRGGGPYKPSVLRTYESDLERHVFPALGRIRLSELQRRDVQALV